MNYAAFDISKGSEGREELRGGTHGVSHRVCRGTVSGTGGDRGTVTGVGMGVVRK